jgi:hypothetical protein
MFGVQVAAAAFRGVRGRLAHEPAGGFAHQPADVDLLGPPPLTAAEESRQEISERVRTVRSRT